MKRRLPTTLDNILYQMHKNIWETGDIKSMELNMYDASVKAAETLGFEVSQHREYVDVYKFVLKEEKKNKILHVRV